MAKDLSAMANNNKSYMAKPGEVESKWYVVDATDMVLGRLRFSSGCHPQRQE